MGMALAMAASALGVENEKLPDYAKVQELLKSKQPVTWVVTGDSITHGCVWTGGRRSYAEHFNERVRGELRRKADVWINTGVSGETTDGLLKAFDFRVARFKPQFVSINLGMNDCVKLPLDDFRKNLESMVQQVRAMNAVPVLHVPNTVRAGHRCAPKLPPYCLAVREIAEKEKVLLVDHKAAWEAAAGGENLARNEWLGDAIHPNELGQIEMAKTMFRALGMFDEKSPTCKLGDGAK